MAFILGFIFRNGKLKNKNEENEIPREKSILSSRHQTFQFGRLFGNDKIKHVGYSIFSFIFPFFSLIAFFLFFAYSFFTKLSNSWVTLIPTAKECFQQWRHFFKTWERREGLYISCLSTAQQDFTPRSDTPYLGTHTSLFEWTEIYEIFEKHLGETS